MSSDFEAEMEKMQAAIINDARKLYSEKVIQHWLQPHNIGVMENPDGEGKIKGPCGDTMQFFLKVQDNKITAIKFITDGCCTTIAAGSVTTQLAQDKTTEQALAIDQPTILKALDGLPPESEHCALLAANTLHQAVKNYLYRHRQEW